MYICKYCGRNLKKKYEECPGCGGTTFTTKAELGETVIKTPPKGGYIINTLDYKKQIKKGNIPIIIGICIITFLSGGELLFFLLTLFSKSSFSDKLDILSILLLFISMPLLIGGTLIIAGITSKRKVKKDMEKALHLANYGTLYKGLKYQHISSGTEIMGKPLSYCIKIHIKNANGVEIPLISNVKYNPKDDDDTVDLLIDMNDFSNFYIDYEIY